MSNTEYSDYHGIRARSPVDALSIAAGASKFKEMELLLSDGVDINGIALYSEGTPLCGAARLLATRSVSFLIEHGADVNRPSKNGTTPLMFACSQGKKKGLQIAKALIAAGADVNYASSGEATALKSAIDRPDPEMVEFLLEHGAEVDGPVGTSQTALMLAARSGDVPALMVLIKYGADRNRPCGLRWAENRTALGLAELEGRKKAVAYLRSLDA